MRCCVRDACATADISAPDVGACTGIVAVVSASCMGHHGSGEAGDLVRLLTVQMHVLLDAFLLMRTNHLVIWTW